MRLIAPIGTPTIAEIHATIEERRAAGRVRPPASCISDIGDYTDWRDSYDSRF